MAESAARNPVDTGLVTGSRCCFVDPDAPSSFHQGLLQSLAMDLQPGSGPRFPPRLVVAGAEDRRWVLPSEALVTAGPPSAPAILRCSHANLYAVAPTRTLRGKDLRVVLSMGGGLWELEPVTLRQKHVACIPPPFLPFGSTPEDTLVIKCIVEGAVVAEACHVIAVNDGPEDNYELQAVCSDLRVTLALRLRAEWQTARPGPPRLAAPAAAQPATAPATGAAGWGEEWGTWTPTENVGRSRDGPQAPTRGWGSEPAVSSSSDAPSVANLLNAGWSQSPDDPARRGFDSPEYQALLSAYAAPPARGPPRRRPPPRPSDHDPLAFHPPLEEEAPPLSNWTPGPPDADGRSEEFFAVRSRAAAAFARHNLLSAAEAAARLAYLEGLQATVSDEWPCTLHTFGTLRTGLAQKGSDLDVSCLFREDPQALLDSAGRLHHKREEQWVRDLGKHLRGKCHKSVEWVHARVPIVKLFAQGTLDPFDVDISLRYAGVRNSTLLALYFAQPEMRALGSVVAFWAKWRGLCGAERGWLTSYAWTLLVLHYLLRHRHVPLTPPHNVEGALPPDGRSHCEAEDMEPDGPSVLVPLHPLAAADPVLTGGLPSDDEVGDLNDVDEGSAGSFRSSRSTHSDRSGSCLPSAEVHAPPPSPPASETGRSVDPPGERPPGTAPDGTPLAAPTPDVAGVDGGRLGRLLAGFWWYYGHAFRFEAEVVNIRRVGEGLLLSEKVGWSPHAIHIEDPYEPHRNLGGLLTPERVQQIRQECAAVYRRFMHFRDLRNALGPRSDPEDA